MGALNQPHDDGIISQPDQTTAATAMASGVEEVLDAKTQAIVDAAVAAFAQQHGIEVPAPAVKPSALQALQQLGRDVEHTTFGAKVLTLAREGVQEAELVDETPVVRALAALVGDIATKLA